MKQLFSRSFWGLVLIIVGLLFLARNVFGIDIPIFGLIFGVILIYIGFSVLFQPSGIRNDHEVMFDEGSFEIKEGGKEYNAIFAKGTFDLRGIKLHDKPMMVEVHVVFGSGVVYVHAGIPLRIEASSVFGSVNLPGGESVSFGDRSYTNKAYDSSRPYIQVNMDCVFGDITVIEKEA